MKAVFINAVEKTVTEVDVPKEKTLQSWYKIIGCDMVEVASYINKENDSILVDEEGLLKPQEHFFAYGVRENILAGNGLIVGVDNEGESVSCHVTAEQVKDKVFFLSYAEVLAITQKQNQK